MGTYIADNGNILECILEHVKEVKIRIQNYKGIKRRRTKI